MAFFAGRRRGLVVGAVVGSHVASNRAHAQEQQKQAAQQQQAELEKQKQQLEYEKKLKEQEERYKKQLEEEKKKDAYYNSPAQMSYAHQRVGNSFSQPAPAGVVPAYVPPGAPPVLGAPPKLVRARVLASYAANSPAELSIQEGEEVVFLRNDPSGWTEVSNKAGRRGFVPQTFIEILK